MSMESIKKTIPGVLVCVVIAALCWLLGKAIPVMSGPVFAILAGISLSFFFPLKELSTFFIIMAMAAIGLNTDVVKLVKSGGKPLFLGLCCWAGITGVSLLMQHMPGLF